MLVPYVRRNLSSFDPFRELDELERAFFGSPAENKGAQFSTDIRDNGDEYVLEADLPGVKKEDIQLDLSDNILTITAERHSEYEQKDKKGNYVRCERSFGILSVKTPSLNSASILSTSMPVVSKLL